MKKSRHLLIKAVVAWLVIFALLMSHLPSISIGLIIPFVLGIIFWEPKRFLIVMPVK